MLQFLRLGPLRLGPHLRAKLTQIARAVFEKIARVETFDDAHHLVLLGSAQPVASSSFLIFSLALYVGHDGSLVRLLSGLRAFSLRWPEFGAEVVFEVRRLYRVRYLRCIHCNLPRCGRLPACTSCG